MKKNLVTILFLFFVLSAFSQNETINKDYYLQKSKHQKTTFYVIAGTGAALIITGFALDPKDEGTYGYTPGFMIAGGILACVISVPFIICSAVNKHKAMSLSIKNEPSLQIQKNSFVYHSIPSLSLKINL